MATNIDQIDLWIQMERTPMIFFQAIPMQHPSLSCQYLNGFPAQFTFRITCLLKKMNK